MNPTLQTLLAGVVDYAGLFPPARLDLERAADHYAERASGPLSWMLGAFVLAGGQLEAFLSWRARSAHLERISVSLVPAPDAVVEQVKAAIGRESESWRVAAIEVPPVAAEHRTRIAELAGDRQVFFEVPWQGDVGAELDQVRELGGAAKIRTGGVVAAAYPAREVVARFILACQERELAFKATAGLHHPVRSEHALTYEEDAPRGTMHGFLNVLGATARASAGGAREEDLVEILSCTDPQAFHIDDSGFSVLAHRFEPSRVQALRKNHFLGFGSCSFDEPVADLRTMGWIA